MSNTHPAGTIQPQSALENQNPPLRGITQVGTSPYHKPEESLSGSLQPHGVSENRNLPETINVATADDITLDPIDEKGTAIQHNRTERVGIEPVPFVPTSPNGMDGASMTTKPSRPRRNSIEAVEELLSDISFVLEDRDDDLKIGHEPMTDSDIVHDDKPTFVDN